MTDFSQLQKELGARIRAERESQGLSQVKVAAAAGLCRTYLADIERGARNISLRNIARLAKALGINISDLFRGIDISYRSPRL